VPGTDLVVRALPASGRATSVALGADLDTSLAAALRRAARASGSAAGAERRPAPRSSTPGVPLIAPVPSTAAASSAGAASPTQPVSAAASSFGAASVTESVMVR
jgi:hypothetical protein